MIAAGLSKRYARALVEAVAEPRDLEAAGQDLLAFLQLLRDHRDLRALFANPGVQRRDKEALLNRLTAALGIGSVVVAFLALLLGKGRLGHLEIIARIYQDLVDERLGRVKAVVTAAVPLEADAEERLRQRLEQVVGKRVYLEVQQDPGILGGLIAQIGSLVYDGSLRTQLARLREQLVRG